MILRAPVFACIALAAASCASGPTSVAAPTTVDVPPAGSSSAGTTTTAASGGPATLPTDPAGPTAGSPRADGLQIIVLKPGSGPKTKPGDRLRVHYVGTLDDGTEFDSSRKAGRTPFVFELGKGHVIKGWEQGMVGMQVGELRKLVIPPELAYGDTARPGLPAHSRLTFEVELLGIE
jgi:peptidylprolyl isomerase